MQKSSIVAVLLLLATTLSCAAADLKTSPEYIDRFHAHITVHEDASLTVREEIDYVNVATFQGKHGIVRDFPTRYIDETGKSIKVQFEILSVEKDGEPVPFKTTSFEVGTRIFIGDPHKILAPGTYHYVLTYDTNRQILFQPNADELYWNVNGNWWVLPIRQVLATIRFPKNVPLDKIQISAYTGSLGAREQSYQTARNPDGSITITSTRPFEPREGLSISLAIPKGLIHQPTSTEELGFFVTHHPGILLLLLGFLAILLLYLVSWLRLRKTQYGTVIPLFHPAENLPPSAHRYVLRKYFDTKEFAADVVQLAVQGFIKIEELSKYGNTRYKIIKTEPTKNTPTALQQTILDTLFGVNSPTETALTLGPSARQAVMETSNKMRSALNTTLKQNFIFHYRYLIVGLSSTLLLGAIALALEPTGGVSVFSIALFVLTVLLAPLAFALHYIYTPAGCKLRDQIKGFELYLKTAESARMGLVGTPPTKTPQLYEKYLPYAIALKAEKQWTAQFAPIFEQLSRANAAYMPIWFIGHGHHGVGAGFDPDLFVHDIAAFSRSLNIPTQSNPTRVSSGMGGGGFSGGGRGGGGGGSW